MTVLDKRNVLPGLASGAGIRLELGCGNRKRDPKSLGIDAIDYECVDLVGDVFEALERLPDGCVKSLHSFHFIEHIPDLERLMEEIARVMQIGGRVQLSAPHFSNPYFYSDYTHKQFFGLYTLCYLAKERLFSRRVPTYGKSLRFTLLRVDLRFKSTRPFYFRHAVKRVFGLIFNSSYYMREFYEENIAFIFPCYEVDYLLERTG